MSNQRATPFNFASTAFLTAGLFDKLVTGLCHSTEGFCYDGRRKDVSAELRLPQRVEDGCGEGRKVGLGS